MSYLGFLALFLVGPIIVLAVLLWRDHRRGTRLPATLRAWPAWSAIALHAVVAVLYTTPWDNYLVASRVWWYDPALVTGIVIGWVPIEEYMFFVLQSILTGMWIVFLARRLTPSPIPPHEQGRIIRVGITAVVGTIWLASVWLLAAGVAPTTYLALTLAWALPPIMLQLVVGADILWRHRTLVFWSLTPVTLFLSAADVLAIGSGTWTINPQQSLALYLGGVLPIEECIFFLLTNTLLVFGVVLLLSPASRNRVPATVRSGLRRRPAAQCQST